MLWKPPSSTPVCVTQPFDSSTAEPAPLDAGWLVHNSGNLKRSGVRLSAIGLSLNYFGCDLSVIDEADNTVLSFGDTGAAREALALAVGALRVAQTGAPTVVGQFDTDQAFSINVLTPVQEQTA